MKKDDCIFIYVFLIGWLFVSSSCIEEVDDKRTPVLTTTSVIDVYQTTAIVSSYVVPNGSSPVNFHGVCWSTNENPVIEDNKTAGSKKAGSYFIDETTDGKETGSFLCELTGLTPGTTYYVRACATNTNGAGYGNTLKFKTFDRDGIVNSFTDSRDGNVYQTITIGRQVWMTENLRYLPEVVGPDIGSESIPCYYVLRYYGDNVLEAKSSTYYNPYGVLYNWPAAMASCPDGWHLPSLNEWLELVNHLGGYLVAGDKLKESGTEHWREPNTGATNESGFNGLPGDFRHFGSGGRFSTDIGFGLGVGLWWSSTDNNNTDSYHLLLHHNFSNTWLEYRNKADGLSIRCVKD